MLASGFAPAACTTTMRGGRSMKPNFVNSMKALPKAEELPRLPPGTTK
jgi:hypothetical protein